MLRPKNSKVGLLCETGKPSFLRKNIRSTTASGGARSFKDAWFRRCCLQTPSFKRNGPTFLAANWSAMFTERNVSKSMPPAFLWFAASFLAASISSLALNPCPWNFCCDSWSATLGRKDESSFQDLWHSNRSSSSCNSSLFVSGFCWRFGGLPLPVTVAADFICW